MGDWWKSSRAQLFVEFVLAGIGVVMGDCVGYALIALGLGGLMYTAWTSGLFSGKTISGRVPLDRAADMIYRSASPSYRQWGLNQSDSVLFEHEMDFFVYSLLVQAQEEGEPVWGKRAPSLPPEIMSPDELNQLSYFYSQGFFKKKETGKKVASNWTDGSIGRKFVRKMCLEVKDSVIRS